MILDIGVGQRPRGDVNLDVERTPHCNIVASAECLPFRNRSFDLVLCSQVLEHLGNPLLALREIGRVMDENGSAEIDFPKKCLTNNCIYQLVYFCLNLPFSLFPHKVLLLMNLLSEYKHQNPRHYHRSIITPKIVQHFFMTERVEESDDILLVFLKQGRKAKFFKRIKPRLNRSISMVLRKKRDASLSYTDLHRQVASILKKE